MKHIILTTLITLLTYTSAQALMPLPTPDIPAGDYTLDHAHSTVVFKLSHLGFSHYTAQFKSFDAHLKLDPAHAEKSAVDVTIDVNSLDLPTPPAGFKDELLGEKWLGAKANPQIKFVSTKIEPLGDNHARISGDLTLHGVTKPITLDATFNGGWKGLPGMDPHARAGFSATARFKRSDFGITTGIPSPATNNMGVSDEVDVTIETEFSGPALPATK